MTTKRTNGPCTCVILRGIFGHAPDCPSLYHAQQELNALTRLVRHIRSSTMHEVEKEEALSLISEAREEQRKAIVRAKNEGLEALARALIERRDKMQGRAEERGRRIGLEEAASIARSRKDFES